MPQGHAHSWNCICKGFGIWHPNCSFLRMHREPGMGTEGELWISEKTALPQLGQPSFPPLLFSHLSAPGSAGLSPWLCPWTAGHISLVLCPGCEQDAAFCVSTNALNSSCLQCVPAGEARPLRFPPFSQTLLKRPLKCPRSGATTGRNKSRKITISSLKTREKRVSSYRAK